MIVSLLLINEPKININSRKTKTCTFCNDYQRKDRRVQLLLVT